jgi:hypothetical protein
MKKTPGRALYGIISVLGLAAAVIPLAIYRFVESAGMGEMDGMAMAMACETACFAEVFVGAAIAVIALASLFIKSPKIGITSSSLLLVGGVAAISVPSFVGLCESAQMACRTITAPTLTVLGTLIIVLAAVRLISSVITVRKASQAV